MTKIMCWLFGHLWAEAYNYQMQTREKVCVHCGEREEIPHRVKPAAHRSSG